MKKILSIIGVALLMQSFVATICSSEAADAPAKTKKTSFKVYDQDKTNKPVSPDLFGGFFELGFGRSDLLWGELLFNRDFELVRPLGEKNPWLTYSRDKKEMEDWWHSGYEEQKWYVLDKQKKEYKIPLVRNNWPSAHGHFYIQIDNTKGDTVKLFAQDRIYLRSGNSFLFSGLFSNTSFFSANKLGNLKSLNICLYKENDFSSCLLKKELVVNTNQFVLTETELKGIDYEGWCTFAIEIPIGTVIAFDLLSLTASDDLKGWKKDPVEKIKNKLNPKTIRFPGGCFASLYDWRDGVGPRDERPVSYDSWWNCEVVNDIGTVEFVDLCETLEAEPFFCVPVMFNNAFNAAEWVDFCNNPSNERRIAFGRKAPLNVKYWELENEPYRRFDAITFSHRCVEFSKQMKKVDPSIQIAVGNYWIYNSKFKEMLDIVGPYVDLITNRGGSIEEMHKDLQILEKYNKANGTNIRLCHTEFRAPLSRGKVEIDGLNQVQNDDEKETLFNRSVRWDYAMIMAEQYICFQNMGFDFFTANFTNMTDGWGESLINVAKEKSYLSAAGVAYSLLRSLDIVYPQVIKYEGFENEYVLQAAWNQERNKLTLFLMSFANIDKEVCIDLREIKQRFKSEAIVSMIAPEYKNSFNSISNPNKIQVQKGVMKVDKKLNIKMAPGSVKAIEIILN